MIKEFKEFIMKGNVLDLAIGVIIGGAFGNIVKSLVDNVIMPLVGVILPGGKGYEGWMITIDHKVIAKQFLLVFIQLPELCLEQDMQRHAHVIQSCHRVAHQCGKQRRLFPQPR